MIVLLFKLFYLTKSDLLYFLFALPKIYLAVVYLISIFSTVDHCQYLQDCQSLNFGEHTIKSTKNLIRTIKLHKLL